MDEIRRVILEVKLDPECGVVTLSRLRRDAARLLRERAALVRESSRILRYRNHDAVERAWEIRRRCPAPRWFSREFENEPNGPTRPD